jgi:hypothetical protein
LKCQFPIGSPSQPGFHFCGVSPLYENPAKAPYCEEHYNIAYDSKLTKAYNAKLKGRANFKNPSDGHKVESNIRDIKIEVD